MTWFQRCLTSAVALHLTLACSLAQEKKAADSKPAAPAGAAEKLDQAALEKQFSEKMTGAVFSGSYSVTGKENGKAPQMEKYTISAATKLKDDYWLFAARVQYGKTDITVPMTLQVKWAGDTPVISLTDLTIPGLGTFTSRVVVYGDRYAGTWQHGKSGGHLWGMLEKAKPEENAKPKDQTAEKKP